MMKKQNKIMVAVSPDATVRAAMLRQLAIRTGFAMTRSDAAKIIRSDIYQIDLSVAYFVLCDGVNLRSSPAITQRLYEMAARGMAVIVGCKAIPRDLEFICEAFYPSDFDRL